MPGKRAYSAVAQSLLTSGCFLRVIILLDFYFFTDDLYNVQLTSSPFGCFLRPLFVPVLYIHLRKRFETHSVSILVSRIHSLHTSQATTGLYLLNYSCFPLGTSQFVCVVSSTLCTTTLMQFLSSMWSGL